MCPGIEVVWAFCFAEGLIRSIVLKANRDGWTKRWAALSNHDECKPKRALCLIKIDTIPSLGTGHHYISGADKQYLYNTFDKS